MEDPKGVQRLDPTIHHEFLDPAKRINEGSDVSTFLTSKAYTDIVTFMLQLNASMFPRNVAGSVQYWDIGSNGLSLPPAVQKLADMLKKSSSWIEEAPPDPGPRRFGNISFRKWYKLLEDRCDSLLDDSLPDLAIAGNDGARSELRSYLLGSFGSAQRLDYGTGHELSFLAFLGGIWKLGGFPESRDGSTERAIVVGVFEPYLDIVRRLILTYTLEPAGTHGVWGLDDHSFLPYVFGSAQLGPAITTPTTNVPVEGSREDAPDPGDVVKGPAVERERKTNMYFAAIGFIYDVKKGPFWEHSPMLYDISGIRDGWAKINKGMIKMYIAEVLSKFPVVQHFRFGYLFAWEKDPKAAAPGATPHASTARPSRNPSSAPLPGTLPHRPAASESSGTVPTTRAPWAATGASSKPIAASNTAPTRAPWASADSPSVSRGLPAGSSTAPTRAPWAKDR